MPNSTVPAADTGLPNLNRRSGLTDSPAGVLGVIRQNAAGATPLGLAAEVLSELLMLLDAHQSAESGHLIALKTWYGNTEGKYCRDPVVTAEHAKFEARYTAARALRLTPKEHRALLAHVKTIAATPSKSVDDLLFKAYIAEATESRLMVLNSLSHAIVRDLLASDCWRA